MHMPHKLLEIPSSFKAYGFIAALFQVQNAYLTTLCGIVLRCFTYSVCRDIPKGWNQLLDQKMQASKILIIYGTGFKLQDNCSHTDHEARVMSYRRYLKIFQDLSGTTDPHCSVVGRQVKSWKSVFLYKRR